MNLIRIHPLDNMAVALEDIPTGETVTAGGSTVTARQAIPRGHKLALAAVPAGARIIKYGCTIGLAKADIAPGDWVHVHNVRTGLSEDGVYAYHPRVGALPPVPPRTFQGYRRPDGRAAIRNELWVLPTVGCVNAIAQALVRENQHLTGGTVEGLYAFPHPFGCSQMGRTMPRPGSCWPPWPATPMRGRAGAGAGVRKSDDGAISGRAGAP